MKFYPRNRYLLIKTKNKEQVEQTGVLLPEGFSLPKDKYVVATVVESAPDCKRDPLHNKEQYPVGKEVVVDNSMVETVSIGAKDFEIVLENYVVGLIREE
tara:strand:- start:133 stop:432 length:300 start_codon:yes stop_codon:yes gene_type:complete